MNRSILTALLCATLLVAAASSSAGAPPPPPSPAATATPSVPAKPVVQRPQADPQIERVLTSMNNASTWGHPDLFGEFAGMRLYSEGHYKSAIKYFKYGARYADKLSQLSIGLMYENGRGVGQDSVTACAWLALAAERKYPSFIATRDRVCEALTPAQHDQAVAVLDKLMPEYGDAVAKKRMARALEIAKTQGTGSRLGFDSGVTTIGVNKGGCGGPTIADAPIAGCGSTDFWSPWRWDPKKYFTARDARWRGVVTVGSVEDVHHAAAAANPANAADKAQPAAPSSAGH
jgi:hypothetical protein